MRASAYVDVNEGEGEGGREAATATSDVRWLDMKSLRSMFLDSDNVAGVKGDGQDEGGTTWRERGGWRAKRWGQVWEWGWGGVVRESWVQYGMVVHWLEHQH